MRTGIPVLIRHTVWRKVLAAKLRELKKGAEEKRCSREKVKRIRLSGDQLGEDQHIRLLGKYSLICLYPDIHSLIFWYSDSRFLDMKFEAMMCRNQ